MEQTQQDQQQDTSQNQQPSFAALIQAMQQTSDQAHTSSPPNRHAVIAALRDISHIITNDEQTSTQINAASRLERSYAILLDESKKAYEFRNHPTPQFAAKHAIDVLFNGLPIIQQSLRRDAIAGYKGDPAALDAHEVMMTYPGFAAITTHRIAHVLYHQGVPYIPRIMSEQAHSMTGVDIHPGATIGNDFFIDHGTGVVIGETTVIGDRVKIYQGVTLGALSLKTDSNGETLMRSKKRHPTIEDDVTIYAGATILGGNTVIGKGAVIGGNVWITKSVLPNKMVYINEPTQEERDLKK